MIVSYYHRRPFSGQQSIERVFDDCRGAMPFEIETKMAVARFCSQGIFKRFYNCIAAISRQSDVNHITGDIHYIAYFLVKRKTLLTIHDCVNLELRQGFRKWLIWFFWYWLPERRSKLITVVSASTKKELLKYLRCDPKKIRVIHNCVSPAFSYVPHTFNDSKPVILQVGTRENKNLFRVAQALKDIPCHLNIVGFLSNKQIQVLQTNRISYSNVVNVSATAMVLQYRDCDMVVFASTYEGFGMPIIEANATGRPIVTSNIYSMPEVAGDAACIVDPFDLLSIREGILRVINDARYRTQLIQNGLKNVARFQPHAIAAKYVAIYKELVALNKINASIWHG